MQMKKMNSHQNGLTNYYIEIHKINKLIKVTNHLQLARIYTSCVHLRLHGLSMFNDFVHCHK